MSELTRGFIGKEDYNLWDGKSDTFNRKTITGGSEILTRIDWDGVDVLHVFGNGSNYTDSTISSALTRIGSTNKVKLRLSRGTWTISNDLVISSNITLCFDPGAIITDDTNNADITINGDISAFDNQQIFDWGNGTGSISIPNSDVFIKWFGATTEGVSDLRSCLSGRRVFLAYHTSIGDGGEGTFEYFSGAAPGTYTDDDGVTIVPTGGNGSAAWIRQYTGDVFIDFFGPDKTGTTDCTAKFNAALALGDIKISPGTYLVADIILDHKKIWGEGKDCKLKAHSSTTIGVLVLHNVGDWDFTRIGNFTVDGDSKTYNGIVFGSEASGLDGRFILENIEIINCNIGIYKPKGNIGNRFNNLYVSYCNYGYFAKGQVSPLMHAGNDVFHGCHFGPNNALCSIYIDNNGADGYGQTVIKDCISESNGGVSVMIKNTLNPVAGLIIDNLWTESNTQGAALTIDGVAYNSADFIFDDAYPIIIKNSYIKSYRLFNGSVLYLDNCRIDALSGYYTYEMDSASYIESYNQHSESQFNDPNILTTHVKPVKSSSNASSSLNSLYWMPHCVSESYHYGAKTSYPMSGAVGYTWTGSVGATSTQVLEGNLYTYAAKFTIVAGSILLDPTHVNTPGRWLAFSAGVKVTGDVTYRVGYTQNEWYGNVYPDEWVRVAGVYYTTGGITSRSAFYGNAAGGFGYIRELQYVEFESKWEAFNWLNTGKFVI